MIKKLVNKFLNLRVRSKMTVMVMFITSIAVLLTWAAFITYNTMYIKKSLIAELALVSDIIGKRTAPGMQFPGSENQEKAENNLHDLQSKSSVVLACIYKNDGHMLARYTQGDKFTCPVRPPILGNYFKDKYLYIHQNIEAITGKVVGSIYLQADMREVNKHLVEFLVGMMTLLVIVLSIAFILTREIQKIISNPVQALTDTAQSITAYDDYSIRATKFYSDELGMLVDDFNQMLSEIQKRDKKLKDVNENLEEMVKERTHKLEKTLTDLESALKAKSNFLSNMSHEIRTPNHAVMNCSKYVEYDLKELIEKLEASGKKPQDKKAVAGLLEMAKSCLDNVERIRKASNYQGHLLNDILDLSKMGEGKMEFDMQPGDLKEVVINTIAENEGLYKGVKALKVVFEEPQVDTKAEFDHTRMRQVLNNLLGNAVKYSEKGTITLNIAAAELEGKKGKKIPGLSCSIMDQGIGIAPEELEAIFEKFTESSRTKKQSGGTGIGLAICKEVVSAHGGKIWAENNGDVGSIFTFIIPRQQDKDKKE